MRCANTRTTQEKTILESLPSGGRLESDAPTLALHRINRESAGNYQLIDEESTRGREFHRQIPVHIHGFGPVRSKFVENPLNGNNSRIRRFKSYILTIPTIFKFKYEGLFKIKNKPDPAILGTSYLSN
jgi:hypothetical protein